MLSAELERVPFPKTVCYSAQYYCVLLQTRTESLALALLVYRLMCVQLHVRYR
jgi:hypothetical protein